ncbi:MAG: AAA family ATPase [Candidatus Woesearchaeota archaeon]
MKTWYHELGFHQNPFSTKPAAFHDDVLGFEKTYDEIQGLIQDSAIIGIFGAYGTGKTTLLKKIISDFGGKRNVIYYSCNRSEKPIRFKRLIARAGNLLQKLFGVKKKGLILLIDESEFIRNRDVNNLLKFRKHFKSVVFVGKHSTPKVKKLLDEEFDLDAISPEKAVELVRSRLGDLDIISDSMIRKIFRLDKNPRRFLKNCETAVMNAYYERETVKDKHI